MSEKVVALRAKQASKGRRRAKAPSTLDVLQVCASASPAAGYPPGAKLREHELAEEFACRARASARCSARSRAAA